MFVPSLSWQNALFLNCLILEKNHFAPLPRQARDKHIMRLEIRIPLFVSRSYFGDCPTAHIPGYTFPVEEYFLDHIIEETGFKIQAPSNGNGRGGGSGGGRNRAGNPRRGAHETAKNIIV